MEQTKWLQMDLEEAKILVVDDQEPNRDLLEALLQAKNYTPILASGGKECLQLLEEVEVDLILLDIMMPGMDGFEVLDHLKKREEWSVIPVIVVTALDGREDKIRGLEKGADEFISKPIDKVELYARLKNLLRSRFLYKSLERSLALQRELQDKKEALISFIVHDLKNPLAGIMGSFQLLDMKMKSGKLDNANAMVEQGYNSSKNLLAMINDILDLSKMEEAVFAIKKEEVPVISFCREIADKLAPLAQTRQRDIVVEVPSEEFTFPLDRGIIERVLTNLILNGLNFTPKNTAVTLKIISNGGLVFKVIDCGSGIPKEFCDSIFDRFSQVENKNTSLRKGHGLGLTFCKVAVETHGGNIVALPPSEEIPGGNVEICF